MNSTTDPKLKSFVPVAAESHFPIQNLPFGVFRRSAEGEARVGVAIGETILDLAACQDCGFFSLPLDNRQRVFHQRSLNPLMALGKNAWASLRTQVSQLLRDDNPTLRDDAKLRQQALVPMSEATLSLPIEIGDYTDFYSSREHATNVGSLFRPDNPLLPNWVHLPVAYHGRASSVVVSGTDLRRPCGQRLPDGASEPVFEPSRLVDFELEVGYVIGTGNSLGEPIVVAEALEHVFGLVLVNDWSARDIQKWEYQPLGPFLAKNFGTSISPWVVPIEALHPFQVSGPTQDPEPLPYLQTPGNPTYDLRLEVHLQPPEANQPTRTCLTNLKHMYWNIRQQIAHHTVSGCNLRTGDLLATGTVSGPAAGSQGCLLELTKGGKQPVELAGGVSRRFLEDGDRVTITGWCQGDGYRVGFGEVTGTILPARQS